MVELMFMAMLWLCVNIAANTSSTQAITSTATAGVTLAAIAVTTAYATAASDPLLGKLVT